MIEDAVRQAGLRASLCYEVSDRNVLGGGVAENERFIRKVGKGDGQIAAMMGMHASFTMSDATIEQCVGIATTQMLAVISTLPKTPPTAPIHLKNTRCRLLIACRS